MEDMHELLTSDNVERARALLACLESGDIDGAKEVIDDLAAIREKDIYQELGKLTRELHDSFNNFSVVLALNILCGKISMSIYCFTPKLEFLFILGFLSLLQLRSRI